jgi:single-strand DNA-binding protein
MILFLANVYFLCNFVQINIKLNFMSVNKVILIGNVGKEPDVRHLDRNVAVANLVLATTERAYTLQNGTQVPERTEWHNIVLWGGLAEVAERYVHKGDRIYIEGKIRTNTYEDQNGIRRYRTEILAESMEMLSSKGTGAPVVENTPSGAPF